MKSRQDIIPTLRNLQAKKIKESDRPMRFSSIVNEILKLRFRGTTR